MVKRRAAIRNGASPHRPASIKIWPAPLQSHVTLEHTSRARHGRRVD